MTWHTDDLELVGLFVDEPAIDPNDAVFQVLAPYGVTDPASLNALVGFVRRSCAIAWADGHRAGQQDLDTGLLNGHGNPYTGADL